VTWWVFRKKLPKMYPNPFFVKIIASLLKWKRLIEKLGYLCNFQPKKSPKVNNSPIGENLPNLVTLVATFVSRRRQPVSRNQVFHE
jgi:hypothetical protein